MRHQVDVRHSFDILRGRELASARQDIMVTWLAPRLQQVRMSDGIKWERVKVRPVGRVDLEAAKRQRELADMAARLEEVLATSCN